MRKLVSFVLFVVLLITVSSCIWVHDRDGGERERRERYEHERGEHGEHFEHDDRR